jgi:hypothetical protein
VSTSNSHSDDHASHAHDIHEHGGHGDPHTVPPGEVIAVNSPQDWFLLAVTLAAALGLIWYGFQWAVTPISGAESASHESAKEHGH